MYRQNKCVYPVLWDLIRKHIWHSYEGQCLLNFHLVCMEDKQALDHLSPMHKAAAEWQKPVELVELHPVLPVLKQYLEFLLCQLEPWALCMVQKQSCHTVLAQFRPVSIKEVRYRYTEPVCSTHSKPNPSMLRSSWMCSSHFSNLSMPGYLRCTNWSGITQQPDV